MLCALNEFYSYKELTQISEADSGFSITLKVLYKMFKKNLKPKFLIFFKMEEEISMCFCSYK